ncbi:MAG TPA: hypothetical protein VFO06_03790 [Gemmatimonadales bacterium]|nr:hypothetical protein [Gemmatimonadales bacterium]
MLRLGAAGAVVALCASGPLPAQLQPLEFFGLRPGATLAATDAQVRRLGAARGLRCNRSTADPRVRDCKATIADPVDGTPLRIWLAAVDSLTGIVTVSGDLTGGQFEHWRSPLETAYGESGARVQGTQWMMQWIRGRQMIRLTWRARPGRIEASVSLVDGPVLDGWQFSGRKGRSAKPAATDSLTN